MNKRPNWTNIWIEFEDWLKDHDEYATGLTTKEKRKIEELVSGTILVSQNGKRHSMMGEK